MHPDPDLDPNLTLMDPVSQAALGAVVAQAATHRHLGYKAALLGAAAGAMPDIDVLFSAGGDFVDQLITHRGITHSLFFAAVAGPTLGSLVFLHERWRDPLVDRDRLKWWIVALTLAVLSHPLLDLLTPYGTQLLLPFSNARFAINAMPIIDPVYTLLLLGGLVLARWVGFPKAHLIATAALLLSSTYLGYGWMLNNAAEQAARLQLARSNPADADDYQIAAFPTIFQVHYRRVVARLPDTDLVGYYSTWNPCEIDWQSAPRINSNGLTDYLASREGRVFEWFAMGWVHYALEPVSSGWRLIAADLRYGFDTDPGKSVFSLEARLDSAGQVVSPISVARSIPSEPESTATNLFASAYAESCSSAGVRRL